VVANNYKNTKQKQWKTIQW